MSLTSHANFCVKCVREENARELHGSHELHVCAGDGERGTDARAEAHYGDNILYRSGILGIRSSTRVQWRVRA